MRKLKILILFYSFQGHTAKLAQAVAAGVKRVPGCMVDLKQVPELVPESVFTKHPKLLRQKQALAHQFPVATVADLLSADAVAFGTPVHFGSFASQLKQFLDQLSPVWVEGRLVDKPAAVFCSAATLHGGEELTLLSLMIPLLNLGMLPIGLPYSQTGTSASFDAASPYGAIFVTGTTGRKKLQPTTAKAAQLLGERLARVARKLK